MSDTEMPLEEAVVAQDETLDSTNAMTSENDNSSPEPSESVTEVSGENNENSGDVPLPSETVVEMPDPLADDFPVKYHVVTEITDYDNPKSFVKFSVSLTGVNGEDFGTKIFMQDLVGIATESIDAVAERLGQDTALRLYNSDNYAALVKIVPKKTTPPPSLNPSAIQDLQQKAEEAKQKQEVIDTQVTALITKNSDLLSAVGVLSDNVSNVRGLLAQMQANQREIVEWLKNVHNALVG